MNTKQDLINAVIEQIKIDVHDGNFVSLDEMLQYLDNDSLIYYLNEDNWPPFEHLFKSK